MLMWITTRILRQAEKQGPGLKAMFKHKETRSNSSTVSQKASDCGLLSNIVRFEVSQCDAFMNAARDLNSPYKSLFKDDDTGSNVHE